MYIHLVTRLQKLESFFPTSISVGKCQGELLQGPRESHAISEPFPVNKAMGVVILTDQDLSQGGSGGLSLTGTM